MLGYYLDLSDLRFTTDHTGKPLRVDMSYQTYCMFTEIRNAALRAQTEQIEKRPGTCRTSLAGGYSAPSFESSHSTESPLNAPPRANGQKISAARSRAEAIFCAPLPVEVPPTDAAVAQDIESPSVIEPGAIVENANSCRRIANTFFPRIFVRDVPHEISEQIDRGVHFLRAWRLYRQYSMDDVAELMGITSNAVATHERGYNAPNETTLKRFSEIYDCDIEQLTARKGTNTKPPREKNINNAYAPVDTDYPVPVLEYMNEGKSPLVAWRLYRHMSLQQVAELYGTSVSNIKQLEASANLREKTREKLAVALRCKPVQLLSPEGLMPRDADAKESASGGVVLHAAAA